MLPAHALQGGGQPEAPEWSSRTRPRAPPCSSGMQEGSVGAFHCPFPGNEVPASISSDNANANAELPPFHISIVLNSTTISTTVSGIDEQPQVLLSTHSLNSKTKAKGLLATIMEPKEVFHPYWNMGC